MIRLQILRGDFIFDDDRLPGRSRMSSHSTCADSQVSEDEHFLPFFPRQYQQAKTQQKAQAIIEQVINSTLVQDAVVLPQAEAAQESQQRTELHAHAHDILSCVMAGCGEQVQAERDFVREVNRVHKETVAELEDMVELPKTNV